MTEKTCSKCLFSFPEELCYRNKITGLIICANCMANLKRNNIPRMRFPQHRKPSQIHAIRIAKEKREREKREIFTC